MWLLETCFFGWLWWEVLIYILYMYKNYNNISEPYTGISRLSSNVLPYAICVVVTFVATLWAPDCVEATVVAEASCNIHIYPRSAQALYKPPPHHHHSHPPAPLQKARGNDSDGGCLGGQRASSASQSERRLGRCFCLLCWGILAVALRPVAHSLQSQQPWECRGKMHCQ